MRIWGRKRTTQTTPDCAPDGAHSVPSRTDISHAAYVAAHAAVQARLDGASIAQEAAVYDAAYAEALDVSRVTG